MAVLKINKIEEKKEEKANKLLSSALKLQKIVLSSY